MQCPAAFSSALCVRSIEQRSASPNVRFEAHNGLKSDIAPCPKSANTGSSHTIRSARGRSPGRDVKLGPGRQGRIEFAMRRLVKAQPARKTREVGPNPQKNEDLGPTNST